MISPMAVSGQEKMYRSYSEGVVREWANTV